MKDSIVAGIKHKADEMNSDAANILDESVSIVSKLLAHVNTEVVLESKEIKELVDRLTRNIYLIPIPVPLEKNFKISRGRICEDPSQPFFEKAEELSFIPEGKSYRPSLGRLNNVGESIFYSCLGSWGSSANAVLSELSANKGEVFNFLESHLRPLDSGNEFDRFLSVVPVGITDYLRRSVPLPFELHQDIVDAYHLFMETANTETRIAFGLCDAFLNDVLQRAGNDALYAVTSAIGSDCMSSDFVDGLLYPSTKYPGHPNLALKTESVKRKLQYSSVVSVQVEDSFGYGIYNLEILRKGYVDNEDLAWE